MSDVLDWQHTVLQSDKDSGRQKALMVCRDHDLGCKCNFGNAVDSKVQLHFLIFKTKVASMKET